MTKKGNTKKALLMSALSLLLCVSMLVGTTFAWFTDEVTSGTNIIAAGNLDVELYHSNKTVPEGKTVSGATDLFGDVTLWEPGAVAYENFTVSNVGTLDFKYLLKLNFTNENAVITDGVAYKLSDILKVAVVENGIDTSMNREDIVANISEEKWQSLASFSLSGNLYDVADVQGRASEQTYGVVIYWKPSADDNNWNVNNGKYVSDYPETGKNELRIELGVKLEATQLVSESDSFGSDYDEGATYKVYSADDLQTAINNGETQIMLMASIEAVGSVIVPADAKVVIDLNGYALTGTVGRDADNNRVHTLVNNGTLTLVNGTVESAGINGGSAIYNYGTMTVENVTVLGAPKVDGSWPSYGINNYGTMTVNGATIKTYHGGIATGGEGVTVINDANVDVGQGTQTGITSWALYTCDNGELTVNGGTFANTKTDTAVNGGGYLCEGGSKAIVINGGNFYGGGMLTGDGYEYIISGGIFDRDVTNYVADDCSVTEYEGLYYVAGPNAKYVKTSTGVRNALEAGQTAILLKDVSLGAITVEIPAGVEATLDLNGYTLTNNNTAPIAINGGTLTLKDSGENGAIVAGSTSTENNDKAAILFGTNGGKFVMESGTLKSTKYAVRSYDTPSEIVINGGKIEAEEYGVYDNTGSVTFNGGEIVSNFYGIAAYGNFTMNGGKITAQCAYLSNGTYDDSVAVINGGELNATVYNCIYWPSAGSLTINGGTITGVNAVYMRSGSLSITGGTLTATGENETALTVENIGGSSGYQAITNVSVTGGTFASVSGPAVTSIADTTGSNSEAVAVTDFIYGGIYNTDPSDCVAEGYTAVKNADGTYSVCAYVTNADELKAVIKTGGSIVLNSDIKVTEILQISKNTVIDGNGATLTYSGSDRAITVAPIDGAVVDLTISNLTVDCSASYCNRAINYNETGNLVLDNVTVTGKPTYGINLQAMSDGANIEINGGSYSACIPLNIWGENSVIVANDVDFITVDNSDAEGYATIALNNDGTDAAEGAVVTINGGSITVTGSNTNGSYAVRNNTATGIINISASTTVVGEMMKKAVSIVKYEGTKDFYSHTSLQNSVKCVEKYNSGWIVLLEDITVDTLEVNGDVTIDTSGFTLTVGSYTGSGKLTVDGKVVYGN